MLDELRIVGLFGWLVFQKFFNLYAPRKRKRILNWLKRKNHVWIIVITTQYKRGVWPNILTVLICSGYYNKISQTGWLINNRHLFLKVLKAGSPRPRHWQTLCLVRAHFLVHRPPSLTVSSHGRKGEGSLWGSLL